MRDVFYERPLRLDLLLLLWLDLPILQSMQILCTLKYIQQDIFVETKRSSFFVRVKMFSDLKIKNYFFNNESNFVKTYFEILVKWDSFFTSNKNVMISRFSTSFSRWIYFKCYVHKTGYLFILQNQHKIQKM